MMDLRSTRTAGRERALNGCGAGVSSQRTGMASVVLTDHAWPDVEVERAIVEAAGHRLVAPYASATEAQIDALVEAEQPAAVMTCWAPVSARAIASAQSLRSWHASAWGWTISPSTTQPDEASG